MSGAGAKVGARVCTQWFPRAYPKKNINLALHVAQLLCKVCKSPQVKNQHISRQTNFKRSQLASISQTCSWWKTLWYLFGLSNEVTLALASHGTAHKIYAWLDGLRSYSPQPLLERPQNGDHSTQAFASHFKTLQSKQRVGLTHHPTDHTHSIRWWKFTQHLNVSTTEKDEQGRTETFLVDAVLQCGTVSCDSCHHMSRWKYLAHQVIDGVFLPRSPFL